MFDCCPFSTFRRRSRPRRELDSTNPPYHTPIDANGPILPPGFFLGGAVPFPSPSIISEKTQRPPCDPATTQPTTAIDGSVRACAGRDGRDGVSFLHFFLFFCPGCCCFGWCSPSWTVRRLVMAGRVVAGATVQLQQLGDSGWIDGQWKWIGDELLEDWLLLWTASN